MKLNEIIKHKSSSILYDKDYEDMNPDAAKEMVKSTEALIKKLTDGQGWYGGASGTDLYNRDWKKDIAKEKKRLAMFKKLAARKVTEGRLDEGYTLKKTSLEKWKKERDFYGDDEENNDYYDDGATKG